VRANVPATPLECATLQRQALDDAPYPEVRFLSDAVDHRFERFDDRLGRVESDIKELKTDIREMRGEIKDMDRRLSGEVGGVAQRLARLEGMVSNLPSTFVFVTTLITSQVTLLGFTFLILRYAPK
jgi:hypothetical protein